jgi:hypothetical protein
VSDKPKTVLICVLCGGERHQWINPWIHYASLSWNMDPRVLSGEFRLRHVPCYGAQNHEAARNLCAETLYHKGDDFLIMIDNDTNLRQKNRLINLVDLPALDLDVVGVPVPVIKMNDEKKGVYANAYTHLGDGTYQTSTMEDLSRAMERDGGLLERDGLGGAVMCIKREVIVALRESNWVPPECARYVSLNEEPPWPSFLLPRDAVGNIIAGEDLFFCRRAKHLGFRCFTSLNHFAGHDHTTDWREIPEVEPMLGLRVDEIKAADVVAA